MTVIISVPRVNEFLYVLCYVILLDYECNHRNDSIVIIVIHILAINVIVTWSSSPSFTCQVHINYSYCQHLLSKVFMGSCLNVVIFQLH